MNKQQLYTFGGALLASTALSGAAHALTWGKVSSANAFSTVPFSIANTIFSATASTANTVSVTPALANRVGARFSNIYSASTAPGTKFSIEISPTGASLSTSTLANVNFMIVGTGGSTFIGTVGATTTCNGSIGFGTQFTIDGCTAAVGTNGAGISLNLGGLMFSSVSFSNASGLAAAGGLVSLTGRVYNTATNGTFESATGTVITSAVPVTTTITAAAGVTVSAVTTPLAFTALSSSNITNATLTMDLVTISVTDTGTVLADTTTAATATTEISSARVTITSSILTGAGVSNVAIYRGAGNTEGATVGTVANFSGGTLTFAIENGSWDGYSFKVQIGFNGTGAIPAAVAGTASITYGIAATGTQAIASASGTVAGSSQGGFRGEVNTFNASTNGPYSSYLRIHNNGGVAGTVTITIRNDSHDSGEMLGSSFTTAAIQPGATMQLSAAEMEGTTTSTKLPSGGANVPTASRSGSYTVQATGPIVGYIQHILFDGANVADLSSFRNGGVTTNNAAP